MTGFLRGSATAMITPFTENGVDFESFGEMIEWQIAGGTDALVVLGTTGEPATMSEEEKENLIRYAVKRTAGRAKVIVGAGHNCTAKAVADAVRAEALGADGILAVTPYCNRCTQAGLITYYGAICGAVRIPVIAYNVPARTGVNLLPETAEQFALFPNLAGIKEASGNMAQILDTARRTRGRYDLYSGDDLLNLPILFAGGSAVVSAVANLVPRAVKKLTDAALAGHISAANGLADALFPLIQACFSEVNPIGIKAGMNFLGFRAGKPRAPLTEFEAEHAERLREEMRRFGLEVRA